jgi:site-specific DNA-methyltransferase (adenine-specific)
MIDTLLNRRNTMDAETLLAQVPSGAVAAAFLDPQYRGVLDHLGLGNEGARQQGRAKLPQMDDSQIASIIAGCARALQPSGHLFLWLDKYHLCEGIKPWLSWCDLQIVTLITWDKLRMGMGHRTRCQTEFCLVLQKPPLRARGVWTDRGIRDNWSEAAPKTHPHAKPPGLTSRLLCAVTSTGDLVLDPAAGGYGVMYAAMDHDRRFLGCDLAGDE